ncbi:MAG: large-conductance mechanosensitive channel protein MscL [Ruminococcaceae bacterium]|nr:large-conductance mechanosensitive channel protein MscL [Oscillospiraceae bacterium]
MAKEKKEKFKLAKDFKAFITRGNVLDMAVGMIVGSAFTAIVNSVVGDLLMPALGMLTGKIDFSEMKWVLVKGVEESVDATTGEVIPAVAEVAIRYGAFIQNVISFLLVALSVFLIVKLFSKLQRKKAEEPKPEPKPDPQIVLLTEIRDLLKKDEEIKN